MSGRPSLNRFLLPGGEWARRCNCCGATHVEDETSYRYASTRRQYSARCRSCDRVAERKRYDQRNPAPNPRGRGKPRQARPCSCLLADLFKLLPGALEND